MATVAMTMVLDEVKGEDLQEKACARHTVYVLEVHRKVSREADRR